VLTTGKTSGDSSDIIQLTELVLISRTCLTYLLMSYKNFIMIGLLHRGIGQTPCSFDHVSCSNQECQSKL